VWIEAIVGLGVDEVAVGDVGGLVWIGAGKLEDRLAGDAVAVRSGDGDGGSEKVAGAAGIGNAGGGEVVILRA
jgi:hypothetical protein